MSNDQPELNHPFIWTGSDEISVEPGVHKFPRGAIVSRSLIGLDEETPPHVTVHSLMCKQDVDGFDTIERIPELPII